jgi:hypothetical protein
MGCQNARNRKAGQGTNLTGLWEKTSELVPDVSRALWKKLVDGSPYGLPPQGSEFCVRATS